MLSKSEFVEQLGDTPDLEMVADYLLIAQENSVNSVSAARRSIAFLYGNGKPIEELSFQDLDEVVRVIDAFPYKKATKQQRWSTLKAYYEWSLDRLRRCGIKVENQLPLKVKFHETQRDVKEEDSGVVFTDEELMFLENKSKIMGIKYHIIFLLLKHSGPRISELMSIRLENLNVKERYFVSGLENGARKRGKVTYFFPKNIVPKLMQYVMTLPAGTEVLFPTRACTAGHASRKSMEKRLGVKTHSFRKTLNTRRMKPMGCPQEVREILINQKPTGVNAANYTKLKLVEKRDLYDQFHPF